MREGRYLGIVPEDILQDMEFWNMEPSHAGTRSSRERVLVPTLPLILHLIFTLDL